MGKHKQNGWKFDDFDNLHKLTSARLQELRSPKPVPNTLRGLLATNLLRDAGRQPQEVVSKEIREHRAYVQLTEHPCFVRMKNIYDTAFNDIVSSTKPRGLGQFERPPEFPELEFLNTVSVWTSCALLYHRGHEYSGAPRKQKSKVKLSQTKRSMLKRATELLRDLRAGGSYLLDYTLRVQLQSQLTALCDQLANSGKRLYRGRTSLIRTVCVAFANSLLGWSIQVRTIVQIQLEFVEMCELPVGSRTVQRYVKQANDEAAERRRREIAKILGSALQSQESPIVAGVPDTM